MAILLPYSEMRNSAIVAKIGGHGGGKLQCREVKGQFVIGVQRITASNC